MINLFHLYTNIITLDIVIFITKGENLFFFVFISKFYYTRIIFYIFLDKVLLVK